VRVRPGRGTPGFGGDDGDSDGRDDHGGDPVAASGKRWA
jgi:hypothetical protein